MILVENLTYGDAVTALLRAGYTTKLEIANTSAEKRYIFTLSMDEKSAQATANDAKDALIAAYHEMEVPSTETSSMSSTAEVPIVVEAVAAHEEEEAPVASTPATTEASEEDTASTEHSSLA